MSGEIEIEDLSEGLERLAALHIQSVLGVRNLHRLSGGANREMWAFEVDTLGDSIPLVLRRAHGNVERDVSGPGVMTLAAEAELLKVAAAHDVPAPPVRFVLKAHDRLGEGYVMDRIEGETIARKILREEAYAKVRPKLARQCGEILGKIHSIPERKLPELKFSGAQGQWEYYRETYDRYDYPHPVFELAFRWLEDRMPTDRSVSFLHGDFRNGNLIVSPKGIEAVLDWEIAHFGDPMEDLAWICVNSWRFGVSEKPVGGFGERADLFAGYESVTGKKVDPQRVRFWELFGSLKWGIMCMTMYNVYAQGIDRSVERAAIGRRTSETEIDLLNMLEGKG